MKSFQFSISLISISITLPPLTRATPASLSAQVTSSLRDSVTKARGVARRLKYRAQHAVLTLKEKIHVAS